MFLRSKSEGGAYSLLTQQEGLEGRADSIDNDSDSGSDGIFKISKTSNNSSNNRYTIEERRTTSDKPSADVAVVILVVVILFILSFITCGILNVIQRKRNIIRTAMETRSSHYNRTIEDLRGSFANHPMTQMVLDGPQAGEYLMTFTHQDKERTASFHMIFTPAFLLDEHNSRGYKISSPHNTSGRGGGTSMMPIDEGYVTNDGSLAWWSFSAGKDGKMVVIEGAFDFENHMLIRGKWVSNSGNFGSVDNFMLSKPAGDEPLLNALPQEEDRADPLHPHTNNIIVASHVITDAIIVDGVQVAVRSELSDIVPQLDEV